MPMKSKVHALPEAVLAGLHERLRANQFTGFVELAEWLRSIGHDIGKSALHSYALQNKQLIKSGSFAPDRANGSMLAKIADQRIECLKVAVQLGPPDKVKEIADSLLKWAYR